MKNPAKNLSPFIVALIYAVIAGLWIFFSDRLLAGFIQDPQMFIRFQTYMGWLFVAVTAFVFYLLLKGSQSKINLFLHDRTIHKKVEDELTLKNQQLQILLNASQQINTKLEISLIMRTLVGSAMGLVDAAGGTAGIMKEGKMFFSEYNKKGDLIEINYVFEPGYGVPGHVMETMSSYITNDAENDSCVIPEIRNALGFYNLINTPIISCNGQLLGCFEIHNSVNRRLFSSLDVEILQGLAANAAVAIENAKMLEEIRKTEDALKKSEDKIKTIFENINDGVLLADIENMRFHFGNKKICQMLGYTKEELIKLGVLDIHPEKDLPHVIDQFEKQAKKEILVAQDIPVKRRDGSIFYADINSSIMTVAGKKCLLGIFRDITKRKKAEKELKTLTEELCTINRIISVIGSKLVLNDILETALDEVLNITGLEGGTICLVTPDETLRLAAHRATSAATILDLTTNNIKIGECLCGNCARDKKPLILRNRKEVLEFATREATRGEDIRFHAAFPMIKGYKCLGVLSVFTRTDNKPSERGLKLIETVAPQIALAIENAQLYGEKVNYAATLEELVKERTAELENKISEIKRINKLFVGRELRMVELKEKIKELEKKVNI